MKKGIGIALFVTLIVALWVVFMRKKPQTEMPKQEALKVNKHSSEFNQSLGAVITAYLSLKDAFVDADTAKIKVQQKSLIAAIDSIKLNELTKDTTGILQTVQAQLVDIRNSVNAILAEKNITEMRQDFKMLSENLYPLLKTVRYEGAKLYWQNCPMAFGEKDGSWISNTEKIINPYLGKNHPEFKGTMLHCGETKDTIQ